MLGVFVELTQWSDIITPDKLALSNLRYAQYCASAARWHAGDSEIATSPLPSPALPASLSLKPKADSSTADGNTMWDDVESTAAPSTTAEGLGEVSEGDDSDSDEGDFDPMKINPAAVAKAAGKYRQMATEEKVWDIPKYQHFFS